MGFQLLIRSEFQQNIRLSMSFSNKFIHIPESSHRGKDPFSSLAAQIGFKKNGFSHSSSNRNIGVTSINRHQSESSEANIFNSRKQHRQQGRNNGNSNYTNSNMQGNYPSSFTNSFTSNNVSNTQNQLPNANGLRQGERQQRSNYANYEKILSNHLHPTAQQLHSNNFQKNISSSNAINNHSFQNLPSNVNRIGNMGNSISKPEFAKDNNRPTFNRFNVGINSGNNFNLGNQNMQLNQNQQMQCNRNQQNILPSPPLSCNNLNYSNNVNLDQQQNNQGIHIHPHILSNNIQPPNPHQNIPTIDYNISNNSQNQINFSSNQSQIRHQVSLTHNNFQQNNNNMWSQNGFNHHNNTDIHPSMNNSTNQLNNPCTSMSSDIMLAEIQALSQKVNQLYKGNKKQIFQYVGQQQQQSSGGAFDYKFGDIFECKDVDYHPSKNEIKKLRQNHQQIVIIIHKPIPPYQPNPPNTYKHTKNNNRNNIKQQITENRNHKNDRNKSIQDIEVSEFAETVLVNYQLQARYKEQVPQNHRNQQCIQWWKHNCFSQKGVYCHKIVGSFQTTRPFFTNQIYELTLKQIQQNHPQIILSHNIADSDNDEQSPYLIEGERDNIFDKVEIKGGGKAELKVNKKHQKVDNDIQIKIIGIYERKCRNTWFHKLFKIQPQNVVNNKMQQFDYKGHIYQAKINLDQLADGNYELISPKYFIGFKVQNLCIGNSLGNITWPGITHVKDIHFKQCSLIIGQDFVSCTIKQLEKPAIVEYYQFPQFIKDILSHYSCERVYRYMSQILQKLNKKLKEMMKEGQKIELLNLDVRKKRWTVKIDLSL